MGVPIQGWRIRKYHSWESPLRSGAMYVLCILIGLLLLGFFVGVPVLMIMNGMWLGALGVIALEVVFGALIYLTVVD